MRPTKMNPRGTALKPCLICKERKLWSGEHDICLPCFNSFEYKVMEANKMTKEEAAGIMRQGELLE